MRNNLTIYGLIYPGETIDDAWDRYALMRSPHECALMGNTPDYNLVTTAADFYIPEVILMRLPRLAPEDVRREFIAKVQEQRDMIKFFMSQTLVHALGFNRQIVYQFPPLDPVTGITMHDPEVVGRYVKEEQWYEEYPGRDLTTELYQYLKTHQSEWEHGPRYPLFRDLPPPRRGKEG